MSSQIQKEINQKKLELARLKSADEVNTARAYQSMMMGSNNPNESMVSDPRIARLEQEISELENSIRPYNSYLERGGRRRYKKKSVKRGGRKRKTRRNTRRRR